MTNVAFVWYWDKASEIFPNWRDGLRAAMEIVQSKCHVDWYMDKKLPEKPYDAYILWCDTISPVFDYVDKWEGKKLLCLTTNPQNVDNLRKMDVVFAESTPVYEDCRKYGVKTVKAFGTDTKFYFPIDVKKDIEAFYPATFSPWKKQSHIAPMGKDLLCIGTIQPDGEHEYNECIKHGVKVKVGYFPASAIRNFYRRAKRVIIPSIHGSERTVLEAMSFNIVPEVNLNNEKAYSYKKEFEESGMKKPRDFVIKNYSEEVYALKILKEVL